MTPYYERGGITIYHGRCEEVVPQLGGIDAVISDPPYGVKNDCDYTRFTQGQKGTGGGHYRRYEAVVGDDAPFDPVRWLGYERVVLWGWNHYATRMPVGTTLIWLKRFDTGFGSFLSDAEVAWMKGGHGVYVHRDLSLQGHAANRRHPTEKPVGLMRWCIEKAGRPATVLDPYMGSGTTLRAAKDMGLRCIGVEVSEAYCEAAARRLEQEVFDFEPAPSVVEA